MPAALIRFDLRSTPLTAEPADLVILPVFQAGSPPDLEWSPALSALDAATGGQLRERVTDEDFRGAYGRSLYLTGPFGRVLLAGCGRANSLPAHRLEQSLSRALDAHIKLKKLARVAVGVPTTGPEPISAPLACAGALVQYTYRSREAKEPGPVIESATLVLADAASEAATRAVLAEVTATVHARALAMDLVNTPSNTKRTDTLVAAAQALAARGLRVEVTSDVNWLAEHMPCFFTVARGSLASDPPKWICVTYTPPGAVRRRVALVGKAVIFDTGGYQVKSDDFMNTMKADMAGSAAVLGALQALAELAPADVEVRAYFAATPNKIDSDAMIPDSIVNTTCGKKVEIRHTDAEGRLTLIDAVTMAEREKPDVIVTVATLTGAAGRAVGMSVALMARDEHRAYRDQMEAAARVVGDRVQTLDVADEDFEDIQSKLDGADIRNTQRGKTRGAQTAAAFVMSGCAESVPLVHLDIAGGDMTDDEKATGIAAKSLVYFTLRA